MSGNSFKKAVVVWEFIDAYGLWRPYDSDVSNVLEFFHREHISLPVDLEQINPKYKSRQVQVGNMTVTNFLKGEKLKLFVFLQTCMRCFSERVWPASLVLSLVGYTTR